MIETRQMPVDYLQKRATITRSGMELNSRNLKDVELTGLGNKFRNTLNRGGSLVIDIRGQLFTVPKTKI